MTITSKDIYKMLDADKELSVDIKGFISNYIEEVPITVAELLKRIDTAFGYVKVVSFERKVNYIVAKGMDTYGRDVDITFYPYDNHFKVSMTDGGGDILYYSIHFYTGDKPGRLTLRQNTKGVEMKSIFEFPIEKSILSKEAAAILAK